MGTLPDGFGLVLDRSVRRFRGGTVLTGGHPGRVVTLTDRGAAALDHLVAGGTPDPATAEVAGRLVASGMAHPRHPARGDREERAVTVVVPVRDRPAALDRCLSSIGRGLPVVVVDDGSRDPGATRAVCAAHGARLVVRGVNGGPGAARNHALEVVDTELVAFVDSDCTVGPGWLDGLVWLFDDPGIAAVAPRVRPPAPSVGGGTRAIDRFARAHSPLDLGPDESEVGPTRAVRYVPTAALVARRDAVAAAGGFEDGLRVGEDVDLVWRLVEAGWRIRYQPSVTVTHTEPDRWRALLARRFRYGTSAGPLAARHPGRLAPVELRPWPTVAVAASLAGRPRTAAGAVAAQAGLLSRTVRPLGIPPLQAWAWSAQGAGWTMVGIGRAATMLATPVLVVAASTGRRGVRAALALALVPPVVEWVRRRPDLDLPRWVAASVADDFAYGAGVWFGCLRARSFGPVLPAVGGRRSGGHDPGRRLTGHRATTTLPVCSEATTAAAR
ncbi:MAG: mycofactocin biosynthesis glycosyltransferase MftF [Acidimicrobiales bacterium]|jgi:mycofactocin system glycosyltransferase